MTNKEKKEKETTLFLEALREANEDVDAAKAYVRLNPVCSRCQKSTDRNVACIKLSNGIGCTFCREKRQACSRVVDFRITHIARQLGWSEVHVRDLYSLHGKFRKGSTKVSGSSPSGANGSRNSKRAVRETVVVIEDDEDREGSEKEDRNFETDSDSDEASMGRRDVSPPKPKKFSDTVSPNKNELASLRKEVELSKRRAEMAEGNFVALVRRVQDFRTSLRSEIHSMPRGVESASGLSRLSAEMETTLDDAGLYMRNISDALMKSRAKWDIQTQAEDDQANEGPSVRQVRRRSPEVPYGTGQKRRKI